MTTGVCFPDSSLSESDSIDLISKSICEAGSNGRKGGSTVHVWGWRFV